MRKAAEDMREILMKDTLNEAKSNAIETDKTMADRASERFDKTMKQFRR